MSIASRARPSATPAEAVVTTPSVDDVFRLIAKRNGGRADVMRHKTQLSPLIEGFLEDLADVLNGRADGAAESAQDVGEGLPSPLPRGEGAGRLSAYAQPVAMEDWAGEVARPTDLARDYGISRSTLHDWQKRGTVIGLLAGSRRHAFPVAQFVDGRPLEGLGKVVAAVKSPRTAWLWLVEPHPSLGGGTPLDQLRHGDVAKVVDLAERDFGPS